MSLRSWLYSLCAVIALAALLVTLVVVLASALDCVASQVASTIRTANVSFQWEWLGFLLVLVASVRDTLYLVESSLID